MKVTAIISDELIEKVREISGGRNITDSVTKALEYYVKQHNIQYVIDEIEKEPLQFNEPALPYGLRAINRKK